MLNKTELNSANLFRLLNRAGDWLVRPSATLPADLLRRARVLNILLLLEISVLGIGTPLGLVNRSSGRILISVSIFLVGALLAYALSKTGEVSLAVWINGLSAIASLSYYVITTPSDPQLLFFDLRSSAMLLALPCFVGGIVAGPRVSLTLTGLGLVVFTAIGVWLVPNFKSTELSDFAFYVVLMRTPVAFLSMTCLLSIIFSRNIVALLDRLARRNVGLQKAAQALNLRRQHSNQLAQDLKEVLSDLRVSFELQLDNADEQQIALSDVGSSLEELSRVARRIDSLAGQAGQVALDAVLVARQGEDEVKTNAASFGRLYQHLELINHSVEELTSEARQIDQVVSSISEVAEETNLLALNASIEAAGRREGVRRFSSVASEVQRLALRSRDAAEEVRQVVGQIQESVSSLSDTSGESHTEAALLSQSSRSAASIVVTIVEAVERSAQAGQEIVGDVKSQQSDVMSIIRVMPNLSEQSREVRKAVRQLLQAVEDLEIARRKLENEVPAPRRKPAATSQAKKDSDSAVGLLEGLTFLPLNSRWHRRWQRLVAPNPKLLPEEQRRSGLLNGMCMFFLLFLAIYLPLTQLNNLIQLNVEPFLALFLLSGLIALVYTLSKLGYYSQALIFFFGAAFCVFVLNFVRLSSELDRQDFIKTSSGLLGLVVMVAAIIADLRSITVVTISTVVLVTVTALVGVDRTPIEMLPLLANPLVLLSSLGLLAAFLHRNITGLTDQLEAQNRRLDANNSELSFKVNQNSDLSVQINNLASHLAQYFDTQMQTTTDQLELLREIRLSLENLERNARSLVLATGQVAQNADEALASAQGGAVGIEKGLALIEEFQARVTRIAAISADLQTQAQEIDQTFGLITELADEIDLLALNATVEATQAREAGRRFAAVAGEVQRLAGRARGASADVREILSRIQVAVGLCVDLTRRGQREIVVLSQTSLDTSRSLQAVLQIVGNTSNLTNQIKDAVQQQAAAISQLVGRIRDINTFGEDFKETTSTAGLTIARLNEVAASLSQSSREGEDAEPQIEKAIVQTV